MNWKQIILAAVVFTIVAQVIHIIGSMLTMGYYMDPSYFCLWSNLMMPAEGPPGTEFFVTSIVINLVIGLIYARVYMMLKDVIPGLDIMKGVNFGVLLFLLVGIPTTLSTYLVLALPIVLLLSWAAEGLLIYLIAGVAFSKLIQ